MRTNILAAFVIALVSLEPSSAEIVSFKLSGVTTSNTGTTTAVDSEFPVGTAWNAIVEWETTSASLFLSDTQGQYQLTEFTLTFAGKSGTWTTSALAGKGTFTLNELGVANDSIQFTTSWGPENLTNPNLADLGPYSINLILEDLTGSAISSLGSAPTSLDLADWSKAGLKIYLNNDANKTILGDIQSIGSPFAPEISVKLPGGKSAVDGKSKQNFGKARIGKKSKPKTFVIRNTGSSPITGIKVSRSGKHKKDFRTGKPSATTLAPGASAKVKVSFKPKGKGKRKATLKIKSNEGGSESFEIGLKGIGK